MCASRAASGGAWPRPRRKNAPEDGLLGREVLEAHGGPASPEGPRERPRSEGLVDTRPTGPARRVARLSGKPGLLCVVGWGADGGQGLDGGTLGRHTETGRLAREATEDREPLRAHGREVARGDGRLPSLLPRPLPPGPPCCVPLWSTGTPGSSPAGPEVHQLAPRVQGGVQAEGSPALLMSQRSGGTRQHPPLLTRRSVRLMGSTVFVTGHSDTQ